MISPFRSRLNALIYIWVIAKIHFRFWCAFNTRVAGFWLVVKINLADWHSPYNESIL